MSSSCDVRSNTLTFYPNVFQGPMGPDRLFVIRDFVVNGGGLVMSGGWTSFQDFRSMANYHGSPVEEVLPVYIGDWDDRVETTEGIRPEILLPDHPIMQEFPEKDWPLFLRYNRLRTKEGATLLARCGEDPFIVIWEYGLCF